jgi:hypothetical protein
VKRNRAAARLGEAVDTYRTEQKGTLDRAARQLLARLVKSPDAGKAFELLKLDRRSVTPFLVTCIQAENLARTFPQRIMKAKMVLKRAESLGTAVAALRTLVDEHIAEQKKPPAFDPLSMSGASELFGRLAETADSAALQRGFCEIVEAKRVLNLIADWIALDRRLAEHNMLRFGATRKRQIKQAGSNAAIRWLAEGVRRATGKPHVAEVADLAQVILGSEVSQDRAAYAARKRQHRQKPVRSRLKNG